MQAFNVAQPVWLKYMQFHFITQYGTEPMCALNDILVHGKSAAEDLEDQLSASDMLPEEDVQPDMKSGDMVQPMDTAQKAEVPPETALIERHESSASLDAGASASNKPAAQDAEAVLNASDNAPAHNGEYRQHGFCCE